MGDGGADGQRRKARPCAAVPRDACRAGCWALAACGLAWLSNPAVWPLPVPFALVWAVAPALARGHQPAPAADAACRSVRQPGQELRLIARRTWRYFETFVTRRTISFRPTISRKPHARPSPPEPRPPTSGCIFCRPSRRTTWAGSVGAQRCSGWSDTLQTIQRMPRFRGHLYNWHDTRDLRVLDPAYVSSVDSGNLAGHLIAVAQACRDWAAASRSR